MSQTIFLKGDETYLVGDVRYTGEAAGYIPETGLDFILSLQKLMFSHGVIKVDVSIDPIKFMECQRMEVK